MTIILKAECPPEKRTELLNLVNNFLIEVYDIGGSVRDHNNIPLQPDYSEEDIYSQDKYENIEQCEIKDEQALEESLWDDCEEHVEGDYIDGEILNDSLGD